MQDTAIAVRYAQADVKNFKKFVAAGGSKDGVSGKPAISGYKYFKMKIPKRKKKKRANKKRKPRADH